jgi:hypothetical protein
MTWRPVSGPDFSPNFIWLAGYYSKKERRLAPAASGEREKGEQWSTLHMDMGGRKTLM